MDLRAIAEDGLAAWRRGDFDRLERLFDPAVEWRWFERGEWDCQGGDDVMRTLRERYAEGFAKGSWSSATAARTASSSSRIRAKSAVPSGLQKPRP